MRYLSPEAFGLFGFFILMQAWMMILDMGLSPTLGREVAKARALKNGFIFSRESNFIICINQHTFKINYKLLLGLITFEIQKITYKRC